MKIPIACTLSKSDLSQRQGEITALRQAVREVRQSPGGFTLRFDSSEENLLAMADLIAKERLCCRFLRFQLIVEPDAGPIWLEISGPNDTARFLLDAFGFNEAYFERSENPVTDHPNQNEILDGEG